MPKIVPVVEGDGEERALPLLLRRLLQEHLNEYGFTIAKPKNARGCGRLTAENGIERYVLHALKEPDCVGVFVLLDNDAARGLYKRGDLEDDCAPCFAHYLAERVQAIRPSCPVVVVVARWEYEAWLLASLETVGPVVGLPENLAYAGDVEAIQAAKGQIETYMPPGQKYLETRDQVRMTANLDFARVRARSRSFRRLENALGQIIDAYLKDAVIVTP